MLLVTGDHGMVTVDRKFDVDDHPDLTRDVDLVGGDARARLVYARPGAAADVLATWREVLGDARAGSCRASRRSRTAGSARSSPRVVDRIGDVVVAARGGTAADPHARWNPASPPLVGQHGGLTADEQLVPLLLAHNA